MSSGWRTVVIQGNMKLSTRDAQLILTDIKQNTEKTVPLDEISRVLIMTMNGMMTTSVLRELAERYISVVFCNKRYQPVAELAAYNLHEEAAGAIMDQAAWTQERKDSIWADIVRCKLANQIRLLEISGKETPETLLAYSRSIEAGDPTNREGQAARVCFHMLFGNGFRRHAPDAVNTALNYGYALMCSGISRALALHGYNTALGIHHDNRRNKFNLACDLMEPFRPFVDQLVSASRINYLNDALKKELILLLQKNCVYAGKTMSIDTAMEMFALDTVRTLSDGRKVFRGVEFE